LIKLICPSGIFGEPVGQMMAEMQSPILQHFCAFKMSLQHCNLKGIKPFPIHGLGQSDILKILDNFNISVSSSIMEKSVVAVISFVVSRDVGEQVNKSLILIVPDCDHQGSPPEIVRFGEVASLNQDFNDVFLAVG
jgi:hypothetical protein